MAQPRRALWWIPPAYLLAAAVFELVLAAHGAVDVAGERIVALGAVLFMLVGAVLAGISKQFGAPRAAVAALAPSAAAFVVARFYTPDPYFAPSLRRYSNGGNVSPGWIFFMVGTALLVGLLTAWAPRAGALATVAALVVLAGTAILAADGH